MAAIRWYFDEDSSNAGVLLALRSQGIDALTVLEAGRAGHSDEDQLIFALQDDRAIYTSNVRDFARLHAVFTAGRRSHNGIVARTKQQMAVGDQVREIAHIQSTFTRESIADQILYIPQSIQSPQRGRLQ